MPGSVRAVFFDAGGTLIHPDAAFLLECLAEVDVHRSPGDLDAAFACATRAVAALSGSADPGNDASRTRHYWGTLFDALDCPVDLRELLRPRILERHRAGRLWTRADAGTAELLAELRAAGLSVAVISNSDGGVEQYLKHAGLHDHLDFVIDSGLVGVEKPDPRIFRIALDRARVDAEHALYVGDLYHVDVVGARAAGLRPVLLDAHGLFGDADCETIRALSELPYLLDAATAGATVPQRTS